MNARAAPSGCGGRSYSEQFLLARASGSAHPITARDPRGAAVHGVDCLDDVRRMRRTDPDDNLPGEPLLRARDQIRRVPT